QRRDDGGVVCLDVLRRLERVEVVGGVLHRRLGSIGLRRERGERRDVGRARERDNRLLHGFPVVLQMRLVVLHRESPAAAAGREQEAGEQENRESFHRQRVAYRRCERPRPAGGSTRSRGSCTCSAASTPRSCGGTSRSPCSSSSSGHCSSRGFRSATPCSRSSSARSPATRSSPSPPSSAPTRACPEWCSSAPRSAAEARSCRPR